MELRAIEEGSIGGIRYRKLVLMDDKLRYISLEVDNMINLTKKSIRKLLKEQGHPNVKLPEHIELE